MKCNKKSNNEEKLIIKLTFIRKVIKTNIKCEVFSHHRSSREIFGTFQRCPKRVFMHGKKDSLK